MRRGGPSRPQILSQDLSSDHGTRPVLFAACRRSHWRYGPRARVDLRLRRHGRPRWRHPEISTARPRSSTACRSCSAPTARSTPPTTSRAAILRGRCGRATRRGSGSRRWRRGGTSGCCAGVTRWLLAQREEHGLVRGGPDVSWVSTEHNLEARALFAGLGEDVSRLDRAIDVYLFAGDHFCQGLGDDVRPLDVQAYGILWLLGHGASRPGRGGRAGDRRGDVRRGPPPPRPDVLRLPPVRRTARTCCGWRGR